LSENRLRVAARRSSAAVARLAALPLHDLLRAETRVLRRPHDLAWQFAGLLAGWWIYVPLHEVLHALGCLAAGGQVTRLELAPAYGGTLLQRALPWVVAGGEYAGRLSGFDTHGSDAVYLVTDMAPCLLTLLPGVWALRRAARRARPLVMGWSLPFALAPFLSLSGDAYEIGAIVVTRLPGWRHHAELLRGDDAVKVAGRLAGAPAIAWAVFAAAALVGVAWALLTYRLGGAVAAGLGEPALESAAGAPASPSGVASSKSSTANCQ
jgi:hypothetical protein